MSKLAAVFGVVVSLLASPLPARAADKKALAGGLLMLGGGGVMALAFDYHSHCPDGYTTHTIQGFKTQCVYIDQFGSDVRDQPTNANLARPGMLYAGGAAIAAGLLVLLLPRATKHAPSITITRTGWVASKSVRF